MERTNGSGEVALLNMLEELHQQLSECVSVGGTSGPAEQVELNVEQPTTHNGPERKEAS